MKYYIIAGEKSGDLHGSHLMKAIVQEDAAAEFRYWGGEAMEQVGGTLVKHYQEMAFMGFWDIIKNLRRILGFIKEAQKDILAYQPDVVILIDYGGFNMRIAKFCKQHQLLNFYYISPKVWAWNTKRAYSIKKNVDKMFVIFPFEKDFFKQFDYEVDFVGNPLLDAIKAFQKSEDFLERHQIAPDKTLVAILPGSRKQEIQKILGGMLAITPAFPDIQFVVGGIGRLPKDFYALAEAQPNIKVVFDETYDLLAHAQAALVTSGTATLETALFGVPQVVCYKASRINYLIAKSVAKVPYISLVNLIMQKEVVKELIQDDFTPEKIKQELQKILPKGLALPQMLQDYQALKAAMGEAGASAYAGKLMVGYLQKAKSLPAS